MRVTGQLIAFAGMVLIGSTLLPASQALAFGQQWRPAGVSAHTAAQPHGYRYVANVPSFRPRTAVAARQHYRPMRDVARYGAYNRVSPRYARLPPTPYRTAPPAYRAPMVGAGAPLWANPFGQMANAWQYPVPMFARQFAWRPAPQPWFADRVSPQERYFRAPQGAPMASYAGQRTRVPMDPRWRGAPAWRPAVANTRPDRYSAASSHAARYQPSIGQRRPTGYPVAFATAAKRGYWRPDRFAQSSNHAAGAGFRPAGYGRGSYTGGAVPARDHDRTTVSADRLPGWVTTYQDPAEVAGCYWCGGS